MSEDYKPVPLSVLAAAVEAVREVPRGDAAPAPSRDREMVGDLDAELNELSELREHAAGLRHSDGNKLKTYVSILCAKYRRALLALRAGDAPAAPAADPRRDTERALQAVRDSDEWARAESENPVDRHIAKGMRVALAIIEDTLRAGPSAEPTSEGASPDALRAIAGLILDWFDLSQTRHLAGRLVYIPASRAEELRAALADVRDVTAKDVADARRHALEEAARLVEEPLSGLSICGAKESIPSASVSEITNFAFRLKAKSIRALSGGPNPGGEA